MTNDNGLTPNPNDKDHDADDASQAAGESRNAPDNNDEPSEVPQGELFGDGETPMAWAAINTLSDGQLHELLAVMQSKAMLPELRPGKYAAHRENRLGVQPNSRPPRSERSLADAGRTPGSLIRTATASRQQQPPPSSAQISKR